MKYNGVRVELNPDEIKCENLSGAYKDMAEIIGIDAVIKFTAHTEGKLYASPLSFSAKIYFISDNQ